MPTALIDFRIVIAELGDKRPFRVKGDSGYSIQVGAFAGEGLYRRPIGNSCTIFKRQWVYDSKGDKRVGYKNDHEATCDEKLVVLQMLAQYMFPDRSVTITVSAKEKGDKLP